MFTYWAQSFVSRFGLVVSRRTDLGSIPLGLFFLFRKATLFVDTVL